METNENATKCDSICRSASSASPDGARQRKRHKTPEIWEQAVELTFGGRLNQDEIAARLGVSRKTIYRWLKKPEMIAKRNEMHRQFQEERLKEVRAKRGW